MPILNVKVSAIRSKELSKEISDMLSALTVEILAKKAQLISIAIEYVDPVDWYIAGKSLADQDSSSFYLDIKITDETNTKDEKAKYIAAVFHFFNQLLGNLHNESYIFVHDARASAYGYGGLTQEYRYHHSA